MRDITDCKKTEETRMTSLPHASSFRDLVVYQKAKAAAKLIFTVTKDFPREEMYSLTDQIRRSSRSMGAQIAEAWSKRRFEKHFISKLTDWLSCKLRLRWNQ